MMYAFFATTAIIMSLLVALFAPNVIRNVALKIYNAYEDRKSVISVVALGTGSSVLSSIVYSLSTGGVNENQQMGVLLALFFAIIFVIGGAIAAEKDKQ
ncbi:MAG: hypothetical protein LBP89_10140 [Helicobacteraceae bacterium]|jgi:hypothetical protein|nr:hypothetical protein [Helicobacteraceae bacterium]